MSRQDFTIDDFVVMHPVVQSLNGFFLAVSLIATIGVFFAIFDHPAYPIETTHWVMLVSVIMCDIIGICIAGRCVYLDAKRNYHKFTREKQD